MTLLSWGMYPKIKSTAFKYEEEEALREIIKSDNEFISYGNGRSYGDSALNTNIINVRPKNYFIDFNYKTGLLHIEAGILLSEILEHFVPRGWFLNVTPGTKLITIGGAIASDVHGKNHHINGCFSEFLKDFNIMLPSGEVINCSKKRTPKLFKATCGGMGLTGVILDAKIYLKKINSQYIDQTTIKTKNLRETFEAFEAFKDKPYSVAWIDCSAKGRKIGKSLLMVGDFRDDGLLNYKTKRQKNIPFNFPCIALNKWSVKAFNWLYYNRVKKNITKQIVNIDTFFYPLDAIGNWNRIYGKNGFTQYQFILPKDASYNGLEEILTTISKSGKGSFLAVLKLCGKTNENWLSFPMEGYSLALDFKIEEGVFKLLNELDKTVIKYKGRIYLTKDARVNKSTFEKGYPQIETFRQYRKDNKMNEKFNSLQSKRVEI